MVMHARNKDRIDGYYEKSSYQNSKRDYERDSSSRTNYSREKDSPLNNGRNSTFRSVSPDSDSPRDRRDRYQSSSYSQKLRDREYKKDKYSDSRSAKRSCYSSSQKSSSRDSREYSSNKNSSSKDKYSGDWSEHVSSSGKKYYYNCKTEVSQWEKPREWLDREPRSKDSRGDRDVYYKDVRDSRDYREKDVGRSEHRGCDRDKGGSGSIGNTKSHSNTSSRSSSRWPPIHEDFPPSSKRSRHSAIPLDEPPTDMDISPGDSTPTSETNYSHSSTPQQQPQSNNDGGGFMSRQSSNNKSQSPQDSNGDLLNNAPGPPHGNSPPVTMAGLPKILSQITGNKQIEQNDLNPQKALQTINNALARSSAASIGHSSPLYAPAYYASSNHKSQDFGLDGGPPTPTQEMQDVEQRRLDVSSNSMSSLQGVMNSSQIGRPQQEPSLSSSYLKYMRNDLIFHVTNWPAEILERQSQKHSEEAHLLGDLQCSKVSTELKCARSLVRMTEITATLQEQKIMYLRQQLHRLESLKSQNSFMSDDL